MEHGGNKSGIPTAWGFITFDPRYMGKPLVFVGTVGIIPGTLHGRLSHEKGAQAGDRIVMAGGRVGKDGIHGATFSSEGMHGQSPRPRRSRSGTRSPRRNWTTHRSRCAIGVSTTP